MAKKRIIILPNEELEIVKKQPVVNRRLLVINKNYQAITTCTLKVAFNESAVIVLPPCDEFPIWQELDWSEWAKLEPKEGETVLQAVSRAFRVPEIIRTIGYGGLHCKNQKLTRRGLFKRDNYCCCYCGKMAGRDDDFSSFSIDHIVPLAQNGKTEWTNVCLSCCECNTKKRDRTPEEAGMKLLKKPTIPEFDVLQGRTIRLDSWNNFLSDCYHEVELKD